MKVWRILTLTMVVAIVGAPLVAGFMSWVAPAVRAGALSLVPPMAAKSPFPVPGLNLASEGQEPHPRRR